MNLLERNALKFVLKHILHTSPDGTQAQQHLENVESIADGAEEVIKGAEEIAQAEKPAVVPPTPVLPLKK